MDTTDGNNGNRNGDETLNFHELEANYAYCVERSSPELLHGGDIQHSSRLLGYADAMMATCATFLVIPLRNLKDKKDDESLDNYLVGNADQFVSFAVGFLLVCTIWESLNIRGIIVKQTDDLYVLLTIISMLLVTTLQFSLALTGHYPKYSISVWVTCAVLVVIELIEALMNLYAFRSTRLLHIFTQKYTSEELKFLRSTMFFKSTINIIAYVLSGLFSLLDYRISWFFITLTLLLPLSRKGIFLVHRMLHGVHEKERCTLFAKFKQGDINKERVETFSDVAIAVIACVLILDITGAGFPTSPGVHTDGLASTLRNMSDEFVMFIIAYLAVSLLWYVNHSIFAHIHTANFVILTLQKLFLMFVSWIPLASSCIHKYGRLDNEDTKVAVRFVGVVIFLGGVCNALMFCWGLYAKEKVFHKRVVCRGLKSNCRKHIYVLLKLVNMPFWMAVLLLGTLGAPSWILTVAAICFTLILVIFVVLKIAFFNYQYEEPMKRGPRALTYHVEPGVIENTFGVTAGTNNIQNGDIATKNSYVNHGLSGEHGIASEAQDEDRDLSDSDVSELRSEYGSFRGGAKYINGVKIEVASCV